MQKTILFLSCLLAATAQAAPNFPGLRTQLGDWDTVCDNTGTCRVAGYHNDGSDNAVSVLFTRPAGKNAATTAQIQIIEECETPAACAQADNTGGELFLNGQSQPEADGTTHRRLRRTPAAVDFRPSGQGVDNPRQSL